MDGLTAQLRRFLSGSDVSRARTWHARSEADRDAARAGRRAEFLRETATRVGFGRLIIGRAENGRGGHQWCGLPFSALDSQHFSVAGGSGSGKSFLLAALLKQMVAARVPVVIVDFKSELVRLMVDVLLPALVAEGHDDLVDQVRVIDPFSSRRVPQLRLTQPEPGVSTQVQALSLAAALAAAVGQDNGLRMQRALLPAAGLAVERNAPLPIILEWLREPVRFAREAATSADPTIRAYAVHELPRENRSSLDALRARLDLLFHLEQVRRALSAPECVDFHAILDSGVTLFDFGSPPGGVEHAMRFIAGPVLARLSRAVLSRTVHARTPQALVLFEEVQEGLTRHQIEQFKRLLSLCRFKRTALGFSNQQVSQIASVDRALAQTMRTNTAIEFVFRSSPEDARALSVGLLIRSPDETLTQSRSRFVEEVASLPRREYFLWLKSAPFGPQRLRSPRLDLDQLRALAARVPESVRQRIQDGTTSIDPRAFEVPTEPAPEPLIVPLPTLPRARRSRLG